MRRLQESKNRVINRRSPRRGAVMTVEFALAILGVILVALITSKVMHWAVGWLANTAAIHEADRITAGTSATAGEHSGLGGTSINLVGPDGYESLNAYDASPTPTAQWSNECTDAQIDDATDLRIQAYNKAYVDPDLTGTRALVLSAHNISGTGDCLRGALSHYTWANDLVRDWKIIEDMREDVLEAIEALAAAEAALAVFGNLTDCYADCEDECPEECNNPNPLTMPAICGCTEAPECNTRDFAEDGISCGGCGTKDNTVCIGECEEDCDQTYQSLLHAINVAQEALHDQWLALIAILEFHEDRDFGPYPRPDEAAINTEAELDDYIGSVVTAMQDDAEDEAARGAQCVRDAIAGEELVFGHAGFVTGYMEDAETAEKDYLSACSAQGIGY